MPRTRTTEAVCQRLRALELLARDPSSPQPVHGRLMMPVHVGDRLADRAELHQDDFHPDRRHVCVNDHERTRTMSIDPADGQSSKVQCS